MTEAEWLTGKDRDAMISFLFVDEGGRTTERKAQLFACACVRRIWMFLSDSRSRTLVEVMERGADGLAGKAEIEAARAGAEAAIDDAIGTWGESSFEHYSAACAWNVAEYAFDVAARAVDLRGMAENDAVGEESDEQEQCQSATEREHAAQVALIHDLFGNPFCSVAIDITWLDWRDGLVRQLAEAAYRQRQLPAGTLDRDRLAVLADALEEAGCDDRDILRHLRRPGSHFRGCFALDLLLGKK